MILNNFTYKPRLITQITKEDFESCGFDFKDFISKILSARNNEVTPFPDKDHELLVGFSAIDKRNEYLGKFRFRFCSEMNRSPIDLYLNFPKAESTYEVERGLSDIFLRKAFPNSTETSGCCFGNFHINTVFNGIFDENNLSINFDTEGNYLPLSAYDHDMIESYSNRIMPSLTYPEEMDEMNPTDLDKMFIPELSSATYGTYTFWLDRFHIASVKDIKQLGYRAHYPQSDETVVCIKVSNTFHNVFEEYYKNNPEFDKAKIASELRCCLMSNRGLFDQNEYHNRWQEYSSLSLTSDGLFSNSKSFILDISTMRSFLDPVERKALEILEALNANPDKYKKMTLFPPSSKKIAEATAPLVSLTSQLVRSTKSFAMEEL